MSVRIAMIAMVALVTNAPAPIHVPRGAHAALVTESEPNDDLVTATPFVAGDSLTGRVGGRGDRDHFVLVLQANDVIELEWVRDSSSLRVTLLAPDGSLLTYSDNREIRATVPAAGTYYVLIESEPSPDPAGYAYGVSTELRTQGPGDPSTRVPFAAGGAIALGGDLVSVVGGSVTRLGLDGSTEEIARLPWNLRGMVVDGFGDLLIAGHEYNDTGVVTKITRVTLTGDTSTFALPPNYVDQLAISPDGDVWAISNGTWQIFHYDAFGRLLGTHQLPGGGYAIRMLGFAPDSTLYLYRPSTLYRWTEAGGLVAVYATEDLPLSAALTDVIGGGAFDTRGYLYLQTGAGGILLLDDEFDVVEHPFAITNVPHAGGAPFFLDDDSGTPTNRLISTFAWGGPPYGVYPWDGSLVEYDQTAVAAPGYSARPVLIRVASDPFPAGLVGAEYAFEITAADGLPGEWSIIEGTLPEGLVLADDGSVSGVPHESGSFEVLVRLDRATSYGGRWLNMDIGVPDIRVSAAADHLMSPGALTEDEARYLDIQGNGDGAFDVADFHAFAIARGLGTAADAEPEGADK